MACSLKEIKCCCIVSEVVYPGTNKVDLFGAEVEVRVDGSVSTVDEETKLAKTAAVADKFVDVGVCMRISSTLESEICKMSALSLFNSLSKCLNALEVHEVNGCVCSHSLGKLKTFLISVYCTDI